MTMLRFEPEKRVGFREYMRSDGTRSYFFCMDTVRDLFTGSGFTEVLILLIAIIYVFSVLNAMAYHYDLSFLKKNKQSNHCSSINLRSSIATS